MIKIAPIFCALTLIGSPASAQVYNLSFNADTGYSGSFGLETSTDTLTYVNFVQGTRIWTLSDIILAGSYVGNGVRYTIGGNPDGLSIRIAPVATIPSDNDFSLNFTLLFGSPRTTFGSVFQSQTVGSGYSYTQGVVVQAAAVPELAGWAMMTFGFGVIGYALRARTRRITQALA